VLPTFVLDRHIREKWVDKCTVNVIEPYSEIERQNLRGRLGLSEATAHIINPCQPPIPTTTSQLLLWLEYSNDMQHIRFLTPLLVLAFRSYLSSISNASLTTS
jgi:hypothetical protein